MLSYSLVIKVSEIKSKFLKVFLIKSNDIRNEGLIELSNMFENY